MQYLPILLQDCIATTNQATGYSKMSWAIGDKMRWELFPFDDDDDDEISDDLQIERTPHWLRTP